MFNQLRLGIRNGLADLNPSSTVAEGQLKRHGIEKQAECMFVRAGPTVGHDASRYMIRTGEKTEYSQVHGQQDILEGNLARSCKSAEARDEFLRQLDFAHGKH